MLAAATIIVPYNPVTGWIGNILHDVAPETFMGSGPQRIVILGFAEDTSIGSDSILMTEVAEDNLELLSIPRSTLTEIPGYGQGEIGDAFVAGGPELTRRTVAQLTRTEVPYYCVVGTEGIRKIVNSMGGVRLEVPQAVSGHPIPGGPQITLRPGPQTLNGAQALVYLQGEDLPGEAERAKRQQGFLYAMFRQALGPSNLLANPSTLNLVLENTETNMSGVELIQLAGRVRQLKDSGGSIEVNTVSKKATSGQQ